VTAVQAKDPRSITATAAALREARSAVELLDKLAIAAGEMDGAAGRVEDADRDSHIAA
jgi:hypothetical protein